MKTELTGTKKENMNSKYRDNTDAMCGQHLYKKQA